MLVQTTQPSIEPVSLAEARNHLRVDSDVTDDDALIGTLIAAARRYAESYTRRSFITQSWRLVLDEFPCRIDLEKGPVQKVDSLTYRDMNGVTQTVAWAAAANSVQRSSDGGMVADLSAAVPTITPAFGRIWPIPMPEAAAVAVNFTAGYGDTADKVPEGIRQWILLRVSTLYENREAAAVLPRGGKVEQLPYVDSLLDPYVVAMA